MSPTKIAAPPEADARELAALYEADETAWLDEMSRLAAARRHDRLDYDHLSEFLSDMAKRDRREVQHRLEILLAHLLKAKFQPEKHLRSWDRTILLQRSRLGSALQSGTLRNHAREVLPTAYEVARKLAEVETGLDPDRFPAQCPLTLEETLGTTPASGDS